MSEAKSQPHQVRFGTFTVNLRSGEVWRNGTRIRLQAQPFQILEAFLERPNELITREALQRRIWPSDTFVDFEQGLNKAINKLRDALGDTADTPQFIETIPKRGYRFIAPIVVEADPDPVLEEPPVAIRPTLTPDADDKPPRRRISWLIPLGLSLALLAVLPIVVLKRQSAQASGLHSVAVLPLLAHNNTADYDLADGTTDGIINSLSLVPNLRVISHASVFQYRGQTVDPRVVGQKLGVDSVLTGRLELTGTTVTMNVELTATSDGRHVWGQQYTRSVSERTDLTAEIAGSIADALRLSLTPARRQEISSQSTSNTEAHQLYLKGRYYFFKETPDDVLLARKLFQDSIDRDPSFAQAYSALGDTYDWMAIEGYQPLSEVLAQATAAKQKAEELNDSLAEVHASLASLELAQWNWSKAEPEFLKALEINPNYFEGHRLYSIYLRSMKRFPEAIQHAKLCTQLNPLLLPAKSHLALTYYYAHQYSAAAEEYRQLLKDDPERAGAHAGLSAALLKAGKEEEALEEWQKALSLAGDDDAAQELSRDYARGGFRAAQSTRLRAELQSLAQLEEKSYVSPMEFADRYALLNDKEAAFRWLEKAYADHSPSLFNINVDPDYDGLRDDAPFVDLVARLHLPQ